MQLHTTLRLGLLENKVRPSIDSAIPPFILEVIIKQHESRQETNKLPDGFCLMVFAIIAVGQNPKSSLDMICLPSVLLLQLLIFLELS